MFEMGNRITTISYWIKQTWIQRLAICLKPWNVSSVNFHFRCTSQNSYISWITMSTLVAHTITREASKIISEAWWITSEAWKSPRRHLTSIPKDGSCTWKLRIMSLCCKSGFRRQLQMLFPCCFLVFSPRGALSVICFSGSRVRHPRS